MDILGFRMNATHFEHVAIALVMQAVIGLLTGNWWTGAAFGAAFFMGREHAQAEERYIKANGGHRYTTPQTPEWAVFNLTWWNSDSLLDWIVPTLTVVAVAAAFQWM